MVPKRVRNASLSAKSSGERTSAPPESPFFNGAYLGIGLQRRRPSFERGLLLSLCGGVCFDLGGGVDSPKARQERLPVREIQRREEVQEAPQLLRVVLNRSSLR